MTLNHACLPISAPGLRLTKVKKIPLMRDLFQFVTWLGLEPRTPSLKVRCSTN
jgi:hypothetical protein